MIYFRRNTLKPLSNDELVQYAPAIGATKPFHEVSERYSFVPTLDAINLLRDQGWEPIEAKQSNVRKVEKDGYQKHIIRFKRTDLEITNEERVDLMLFNSHDRGCAFNLIASVWRKICSNGLMVSSDLYNFKHKHINFDREAFQESAVTIANGANEIANHVDNLKSIELTPDERGVFAMTAHRAFYDEPLQAPIRAEQLLKTKRYDDMGNDLWTTFNVIQENITKGGLSGRSKKTGKRQRTRAIKSIEKDVKTNKLLWFLTTEMAKLKAA